MLRFWSTSEVSNSETVWSRKKNSHRKYTTLASHPLDISQPTNVSLCTYGGHPM